MARWWLAGLAALVLGGPLAAEDIRVALVFAPPADAAYVVRYVEDQTWDYRPKDDMHGTLRTELTLRWAFARAPEAKTIRATGAFERVLYRGQGVKLGKRFDIDVEWNATDKYLRGEGSDADRTWAKQEIARGVTLTVNNRGACADGEC